MGTCPCNALVLLVFVALIAAPVLPHNRMLVFNSKHHPRSTMLYASIKGSESDAAGGKKTESTSSWSIARALFPPRPIDLNQKRSRPNSSKNHLQRKCPICAKVFTPAQLRFHMRYKHTCRNTSCPTCGKIVPDIALRAHIRYVHATENQMIPCGICSATFARRYDLSVHMLKHSGDRPFNCTVCKKAFRQKQHLNVHIRDVHRIGAIRTFPCPVCSRNFNRKHNLNLHVKRFHQTQPSPKNGTETIQKTIDKLERKSRYLELVLSNEDWDWCSDSSVRYAATPVLAPKARIVCQICGTKFGYPRSLYLHMAEVHRSLLEVGMTSINKNDTNKEKENENFSLVNNSLLTLDKRQNRNLLSTGLSWRYKCSVCDVGFGNRILFVQHALSHSHESLN
mmetsp:Transcript_25003/g.60151  ORF Transcript_25003/g.60151 Transcript_25003/m.60151 type:complete len:395 (+) Transcript_25003:101-1285(+)